MIAVLLSAAGLLLAAFASELALRGHRIQTGASRAALCFLAAGAATALVTWRIAPADAIVFAVLWVGAFLFWLGGRSHVESSILLRMIHMLSTAPRSRATLLDLYERHYDLDMRLRELEKAGLVEVAGEVPRLTSRGRAVLGVYRLLR